MNCVEVEGLQPLRYSGSGEEAEKIIAQRATPAVALEIHFFLAPIIVSTSINETFSSEPDFSKEGAWLEDESNRPDLSISEAEIGI